MARSTVETWSGLARSEVARGGGAVERPAGPDARLLVRWVRTAPRADLPPVLAIPGGPGLASVLPYRALRRRATRRGLDLIMVEHRGIGLSRRDLDGTDLAVEHVTVTDAVDDLAAVLDAAGVARAVVYGSSYGTYLAQAFGVRHPDRVAGMVLDSPMLSVVDDLATVRAHLRRLLWDGLDPDTARSAALLRRMVSDGVVAADEIGLPVQIAYEFGGPALLARLLGTRSRRGAGLTWREIVRIGTSEVDGPGRPLVYEPDLVRGIAFGELGFGLPPDGHPLDPQRAFAGAARDAPEFAGEPFDLPDALGSFAWPLAVVSGDRDLRTPRPIAERIVGLAQDAVLVPLSATGHSALDTHHLAALEIAGRVAAGEHRTLPGDAATIAASPRRGASGLLGPLVSTGLAVDRLRPAR
ncbi:alpha/beta fold hydrolase [Pseudonocardia endophytica]|uniref:Alpha/beta hydrolase family protein n=1 Tax=Pseudonocardia endophytica TaxID=401976 RepID=A0A4R1HK44_PSEEN|nr:alpha/beta hydrolase [Pseudonocardia endophytica]TCK21283.1 alpha/beta hydrolase family protein [Pseudonocardia endophytica]